MPHLVGEALPERLRRRPAFPQARAVTSDEAVSSIARRIAAKLADLATLRAALGAPVDELAISAPLDEAGLAALEQELGTPLPPAYRALAQALGTSGAGPDGGLLGAAAPLPFYEPEEEPAAARARLARPFLLEAAWHPLSDDGEPHPPPFLAAHPEATLYDGVMPLTDLGDGSLTLLVLRGPRAGEVWEDRTAEGGALAPLGPLLPWYEDWLDELLVDALMEHLRLVMPPGQTSPVHEQLERWGSLLDERAARPAASAADVAAQALWKLAQGRMAEADTLIARLERCASGQAEEPALPEGTSAEWLEEIVEALTLWSLAEDAADALDRYPPGERLMTHRSWRLRRLLAQNPHTPALALSWLAGDGRLEVRCAVAANPGATAKVLGESLLAATTLWAARVDHVEALFVLDLLARHPAWPADKLAEFARWAELWPQHRTAPWVARAVAANPSASVELLTTLAGHSHACVREAAAQRTELPAQTLSALAADADACVREAAARNPALPAAALASLAADAEERARTRIAQRAELPAEVQRALATDLSTAVLLALGEHPTLDREAARLLALRPPIVLPDEADELAFEGPYEAELLAPREDHEAAAPLTGAPALFLAFAPGWPQRRRPPDEQLLEGPPGAALATVVTARALAHPGFPSSLLEPLADEAAAGTDELHELSGRAIAEHPWPSEAAMLRLCEAPYVPTRARLATRAALPATVLARLIEDPAPLVQRRLAERSPSALPATLLERWASAEQAETRAAAAVCASAAPALLERLAGDAQPYVRCALARNPAATPALLEKLASDPDETVRCALLWRAELSDELVARLERDETAEVRAWASWRRERERVTRG